VEVVKFNSTGIINSLLKLNFFRTSRHGQPFLISPLSFALVLLSIAWARCLGEMLTVKRASSHLTQSLLIGRKAINISSLEKST
jgi:hypothetical protein